MLWRRSATLNPPHPLPPPVPGSDTVRQAALQASWRRDRRVAQRRIAWRWTVWYAQRYAPHALAALVLLTGVAYFSGALHSWRRSADPVNTTAPSGVRVPYSPPSVPTAPVVATGMPALSEAPTDQPLLLRASQGLGTQTATAAPARETAASPDTLSLKPENWLHSKEP